MEGSSKISPILIELQKKLEKERALERLRDARVYIFGSVIEVKYILAEIGNPWRSWIFQPFRDTLRG